MRVCEWIGLLVESLVPLRDGLCAMPVGTRFTVMSSYWGRLDLAGATCAHCGITPYVSRVPRTNVRIVGRSFAPKWRGRAGGAFDRMPVEEEKGGAK